MKASMKSTRSRRRQRWVVLVLAVFATGAQAELVDITWDAAGRFETTLSVPSGGFVEVCGKLAKGQSIAWSFKGDKPTNFNIHYHAGKDVEYPAKLVAVARADDTLQVKITQDYCWMWSNKSAVPTTLSLTLQR